MNRSRIVAVCVGLAVAGYFFQSKSPGPSIGGVAGIAEDFQRSRATAQADVYELLAIRIEAGEFKEGSALGRETEKLIASSSDGLLSALQSSAAESLPESEITDAAAVASWYRAVSKGYRRAGR